MSSIAGTGAKLSLVNILLELTFVNLRGMWSIVHIVQERGGHMRVQTAGDLGALIRERRQQLGMDQKTLAAKAGVSRFWVIGIEGGKPRAEVGLVLRTLRALGLVMDVDAPVETHERPAARRGRTNAGPAPRVDLDALINSLAKRKRR